MLTRPVHALNERNALNTRLRRRRCIHVIILSKQPSDGKASVPKMPDVEIQIREALLRDPMDNLQFDLPDFHPIRMCLVHTLGAEEEAAALLRLQKAETAGPLRLHPHPRDVQRLEVHVRTLPTQPACLGLDAKQRAFGGVSPRNVDQDVPAGPL